ncbi:membrane attack complex component perforin, partial [Fusarium longipes]
MTAPENKETNGKKDGDEPAEEVKKMLFEIYFVDTSTKATQLEKIAPVDKIETSKKLSEVRTHLRANQALSWKEASCTFCTVSGAELKDSLTLSDYIVLAASGGEKHGAEPDQSQQVVASGWEIKQEEKEIVKVYFRSIKRNLGLDEKTKEFLKQKMEFEFKKAELLPEAERKMLNGSYNHQDFMATAGTGSIIHPADMTEQQWNSVVETNSLLHGNTIVREAENLPITVERAMYPAFRLKPRIMFDFTEDAPKEDESGKSKVNANGKRPSDAISEEYRIPRFIVTDDAYIEVSEHKTSVMTAIAESSLSKNSSEIAIGGGAFGWSVA